MYSSITWACCAIAHTHTHTSTNVSSFTMQMYIFREMYDWWTIADSLYSRQSLSFTSLTIFHVVFPSFIYSVCFCLFSTWFSIVFNPSMNWSEQQPWSETTTPSTKIGIGITAVNVNQPEPNKYKRRKNKQLRKIQLQNPLSGVLAMKFDEKSDKRIAYLEVLIYFRPKKGEIWDKI